MQIQVSTDHEIDGSVDLTAHIEGVVQKNLHHLKGQIMRVEVHLDDENGAKGGANDKRCVMEARPRHHQPVAVSHKAGNVHQAVDGAARKLKSSLEHLFGKLEDRHHRQQVEEADSHEGPVIQ